MLRLAEDDAADFIVAPRPKTTSAREENAEVYSCSAGVCKLSQPGVGNHHALFATNQDMLLIVMLEQKREVTSER